MSLVWPAVSRKRRPLPSPSTARWSLVEKPPLLRPRACCPCFFERLLHKGELAKQCYQSSSFRSLGHWHKNRRAFQRLFSGSNWRSVYRHCSICRRPAVTTAIVLRYVQPTAQQRGTSDTYSASRYKCLGKSVETIASSPIGNLLVELSACKEIILIYQRNLSSRADVFR